MTDVTSAITEPALCPNCRKAPSLCVCDALAQVNNTHGVLILRHPQEQDRELGTAHIASLQLKNAVIKTGLSWPNITKALGRPADAKRWGVLYLGTTKASQDLPDDVLTIVDKNGVAALDQSPLDDLDGIILLDGNWSQAKALWWRNAWLLKCQRLVLQPPKPSLYGNLRKEPRRESISTIEAAALTLATLEGDDELEEQILAPFRLLLQKAAATGAGKPPKKDWRRHKNRKKR